MLTAAQLVAAKRALGMNSAAEANYPFIDSFWSANRILTTLPPATELEVVAILVRLAAIEAEVDLARRRLKASAVGRIALRPDEIGALRSELRTWRRELSTITGVPCVGQGSQMMVL